MEPARTPGSGSAVRQGPRDGDSGTQGPDVALAELEAAVAEYEPFADFRLLSAARALLADVR